MQILFAIISITRYVSYSVSSGAYSCLVSLHVLAGGGEAYSVSSWHIHALRLRNFPSRMSFHVFLFFLSPRSYTIDGHQMRSAEPLLQPHLPMYHFVMPLTGYVLLI